MLACVLWHLTASAESDAHDGEPTCRVRSKQHGSQQRGGHPQRAVQRVQSPLLSFAVCAQWSSHVLGSGGVAHHPELGGGKVPLGDRPVGQTPCLLHCWHLPGTFQISTHWVRARSHVSPSLRRAGGNHHSLMLVSASFFFLPTTLFLRCRTNGGPEPTLSSPS